MYRNSKLLWIAFATMLAGPACVSIPEACGENTKKVTRLNFHGPSNLQGAFAGYTVEVEIEKKDPALSAEACYVVRERDPWPKLFWAVDDVLTAGSVFIPPGAISQVKEGDFVLKAESDEVCGSASLFIEPGCADEGDAEVYLQPIGVPGPDSPVHQVRAY